ncbi:EIN3-binding F-box protein 1-like [Iris pallida]|uniref:EIN3-binding F-box protein 1-like n=1 Tax=Iris pallida TaxID=29817 RepID=A0AAX6I3U0_IRIPA|nr:EIN3-binding F-box protein 1-like [Iris pallida]
MPALVNLGGHDDIRFRGPLDRTLYCHPRKRSRLVVAKHQQQQKSRSIDTLPDECLFEILRRVPGSRDRSVSACVSKRWLSLLSSIRPFEIHQPTVSVLKSPRKSLPDLNFVAVDEAEEEEEEDNTGCLTRCLDGREATDARLAAIAVGTAGRGGLGKLMIGGSHPTRGVTDIGLSAVARGCPSLRVLSMWKLPSVTDQGLVEVAASCPMLEKLDLCRCPLITDKGLVAIAERCPNLTSLSVDSCSGIANEGLHAIGRLCPKLASVAIKDCPLVGDQGIAGLMCSASSTLAKMNLEGLNISDLSLACIGHYGKAVTSLYLTRLHNVAERGFWVMGNAHGLEKLRSIFITSCHGVTDVGLEAVAKGCPTLKQLRLNMCSYLSDVGLKAFAEKAFALEHLHLEECHRVTLVGVLSSLIICSGKLKTLSLVKCAGIKDISCFPRSLPLCGSLRSLTVHDCLGFTSSSLSVVGKICPNLVQLDLGGLVGLTDVGLLPLAERSNTGLVKVNLKGCANLTDAVISTLVKAHGSTLKELNLYDCNKLTDNILLAVAGSCTKLEDLDMSKAAITDYGVAVLASARHLNLQVLSLAGCSLLTTKILPLLGNMGSSLLGLNLKNCNNISTNGIASLEEKMYWCDILS